MKNRELILMLVDKSINAFGQLKGLTEEEKFNKALSITEKTIRDSFFINSSDLSKKTLSDLLEKGQFSIGQAQQLTDLLWAQAEILLKLNRSEESMIHYKNALVILKWKAKQHFEKVNLERKNKINELEEIIESLKLPEKMDLN